MDEEPNNVQYLPLYILNGTVPRAVWQSLVIDHDYLSFPKSVE